MIKLIITLFVVLLSSCATMVEDDRVNLRAKTQCPINYHLQASAPYKVGKDKQAENKNQYSVEFKCVADSDKDIEIKYN